VPEVTGGDVEAVVPRVIVGQLGAAKVIRKYDLEFAEAAVGLDDLANRGL
jgi:hypothetical protein